MHLRKHPRTLRIAWLQNVAANYVTTMPLTAAVNLVSVLLLLFVLLLLSLLSWLLFICSRATALITSLIPATASW